MAVVGLKYLYGGKYTDTNGTITYADSKLIAKATKCDISVSNNDVKFYADDVLAESETSFQNGSINFGIDDMSAENYAYLLGHTYSSNDKTVTVKSSDAAPYLGIGFINKTRKDGVAGYRATFLPKVQFAEPSESLETKGENTSFQAPTLTGNVMQKSDETWKVCYYDTTEAACVTWLETQLGITD